MMLGNVTILHDAFSLLFSSEYWSINGGGAAILDHLNVSDSLSVYGVSIVR